ncbi:hypothetical protein BDY19DRAFT_237781 [Irpex rosettiformis]|uniref:Uncharacterized protein n=1 Tax=Irpex rosettiformis TaxID=378272 RepID=A0ACB8U016_9APHY|nr:hypothetical protein BDY19DRAFT_237781 [Irpex rosettiformis]
MCSDTSRTQDTICAFPNCNNRVWQDPDGSYSSYCGTTHRDAAVLSDPAAMCKRCKQRPVYVENGRRHDYCGMRCASNVSSAPTSSALSVVATCSTPGCTKPVFIGPDGSASQWCSQAHRT